MAVIISVGYRVKSNRGTQFRIWATGILKEYMRKGFALGDDRLKELGMVRLRQRSFIQEQMQKKNSLCNQQM